MNTTIKKRIEKINSGRVPEGYEKTSFGIFPRDWIKVSLGEVSEKKGEYGLNAPACEYKEGLPKYLRITDIDDQGRYIDNKACVNDADSHKYVLNKGDIVFARTGASVGKNYIYDEKDGILVYAGFLIKFSIKSQYNAYLICSNCRTKKYDNWVAKMCARSGQPGINAEEYATYSFIIPKSPQEQSRIAEILMQWDKAIELQEKLIKSYQKLKKYYLSKMFPKKGSLYPEIRFAGFTEPWEQKNASEIAEYDKGSGYSKCDLVESGTPLILYGRLYTKYQFAIDEVDTFANIKDGAVLSKGGEVIIPASGETAEDIARASAITISGVLLGGDLNILRPYTFLNPIFLALSISNGESKNQLAKKAHGKTIVHIHNSDIKEVSIFYPSKEEQDKIVAFFRSLDNISSLFQGRLNKLIEQRKALQQYLLTGIVRV